MSTRRGAFCLPPVTLEVVRGEVVYLAGPNGRGKSTLLALVAGLLEPTAGSVRFGGEPWSVPGQRVAPWERGIGYLSQEPALWPHLTVRAQCRLVASQPGASADDARMEALARALGVESFLARRPGDLSGGEAQRCAVLRALAPGHALVLLDEPYSQQHADGVERIDAVIAAECERGVAVLVAGHRSPPAARRVEISPPDAPPPAPS